MNYEFAVQSDKEDDLHMFLLDPAKLGNCPFLINPPKNHQNIYMCLIKRRKMGILQPEQYDLYLQLGELTFCSI